MARLNVRHSSHDPEYERVVGLRKSRSKNYWANILIILGILTFMIYGMGIIFLLWGISKKVNAKHLKVKYKE